jgi:hypothetical protein
MKKDINRNTRLVTSVAICSLLIAMAITGVSASRSIPSPDDSSLNIEVENGLACGSADLRWCPAGDMDQINFQITVRDWNNDPIPDADVTLEISGECDPQDELGANANMMIAGNSLRLGTTDSSGYVEFEITGGGAGRFYLNYIVECRGIELFNSATPTLCAKSPDFTGDGTINFFDTFKYLPQLNSGSGWSGDLRCDGVVNFFDTFQYLPHLNHGGTTPGFTLPKTTLGECP